MWRPPPKDPPEPKTFVRVLVSEQFAAEDGEGSSDEGVMDLAPIPVVPPAQRSIRPVREEVVPKVVPHAIAPERDEGQGPSGSWDRTCMMRTDPTPRSQDEDEEVEPKDEMKPPAADFISKWIESKGRSAAVSASADGLAAAVRAAEDELEAQGIIPPTREPERQQKTYHPDIWAVAATLDKGQSGKGTDKEKSLEVKKKKKKTKR